MQKKSSRKSVVFRRSALALASAGLCVATGAAHAFQIETDPDWKVNFDTTVQYNLGVRAKDVDPRLGNNPVLTESEHRFAGRGDVVTNRLAITPEFDAVYQKRFGVRLSASVWKDFAYDESTRSTPWSALGLPSNYINGRYSSSVERYQVEGGELMDAFVFANFDLNDRPASIKLGKMTQYWGNSLFFSGAGVSYSQAATNALKQLTAPGTQAKDLVMPRGQINFSTQLSDEWQLGGQYFLQWQADRMPAGGTYLGMADFLFEGPDQMAVAALQPPHMPLPRSATAKPKNVNDNFGLQARWSPQWLDGTMGFYYRQFDETAPWDPMLPGMFNPHFDPANPAFGPAAFPTGYRFAYPQQTKMLAWSLDKQIGGASVGMEVSYRKNTGLNTLTTFDPINNLDGSRGARGDTLNVVANALSILDRSPWYDTGTLLGEIAVVHKLKVTEQAQAYKGKGTPACTAFATQDGAMSASGNYTGCSTNTAVAVAGVFEPQWLQAVPGWDLSLPMFGMYGLSGNAASNGMSVKQGDLMYGIGVKGVLNSRHNFTLQYNGFKGKTPDMVNMGPMGMVYSAAGNSMYRYNDRNWLSFTYSTTF